MKLKMFKVITSAVLIGSLSSCNLYSVATFQPDQNNGSDCPNPIYVATMSVSSKEIKDGAAIYNQESMTLTYLLAEARKKYGDDVTIHNIRWDIKNRKMKTGAIYDVIKCK